MEHLTNWGRENVTREREREREREGERLLMAFFGF
jgi:hypothetical protein